LNVPAEHYLERQGYGGEMDRKASQNAHVFIARAPPPSKLLHELTTNFIAAKSGEC